MPKKVQNLLVLASIHFLDPNKFLTKVIPKEISLN